MVQALLLDYAQFKPANGDFEVQTLFDTERNHYQILHLGWQNKRWVHHCTIHLDIRDEQIWLFKNSTEHDIEEDLMNFGVPKTDIVLGFVPAKIRAMMGSAPGINICSAP
ncbi:MAG: XisI protein [Okeania sp. SIO1I7]|nr:XisI protein [Okeania sp. SIO1I7]